MALFNAQLTTVVLRTLGAVLVVAASCLAVPATAGTGIDVTTGGVPASISPRAKSCADVTIVGARGSGEENSEGQGFGERVVAFVDDLEIALNGTGRRVNRAPILDPNYPALGVGAILTGAITLDNRYFKGLGEGVRTGLLYLRTRAKRCPDETFVLAGYSQGAMIMHRILYALRGRSDADLLARIDGAALIADGDRQRNAGTHLIGSPAAGERGTGIAATLGQDDHLPGSMKSLTWAICTKNDVVCDFRAQKLIAGKRIHSGDDYRRGSALLMTAAEGIADQIRRTPEPDKGQSIHGDVGVAIVPLQLEADVKPGYGLEWRLDPRGRGAPDGLELSMGGLVTGIPTDDDTGYLDYQVRGTRTGAPTRWVSGSLPFDFVGGPSGPDSEVTWTRFDNADIQNIDSNNEGVAGPGGLIYWPGNMKGSGGSTYDILGVDPSNGKVRRVITLPAGHELLLGNGFVASADKSSLWVGTGASGRSAPTVFRYDGMAAKPARSYAVDACRRDQYGQGTITSVSAVGDGTAWAVGHACSGKDSMFHLTSSGKVTETSNEAQFNELQVLDGTVWSAGYDHGGIGNYLLGTRASGDQIRIPWPDWLETSHGSDFIGVTPDSTFVVRAWVDANAGKGDARKTYEWRWGIYDLPSDSWRRSSTGPNEFGVVATDGTFWTGVNTGPDSPLAIWDPRSGTETYPDVPAGVFPVALANGSMFGIGGYEGDYFDPDSIYFYRFDRR